MIKKAKERSELQTQKEGQDRLRKVAELEQVQAKNSSMLGPSGRRAIRKGSKGTRKEGRCGD